MRGAVVVTKGGERTNFQATSAKWRVLAAYLVVNGGRVFALNHENRFADFDPFHAVGIDWEGGEPEFLEVLVAARMNRASVLVCRKLIAPAVQDEGFFKLGQQYGAAGRRSGGGDQQPVIAPSVYARDRRRGITAQSISLEPFP